MEFYKTKMARSSVSLQARTADSFSQDLTANVQITMKKYAYNMMYFFEGISSRLSKLELYCYNVDNTIGEMRPGLTHVNEE
uniref:Uncharacterized protein n=1 Tax=Noccaea caerulescens TaxID=107243 RepID=A0A1J3GZH8_NOCCA